MKTNLFTTSANEAAEVVKTSLFTTSASKAAEVVKTSLSTTSTHEAAEVVKTSRFTTSASEDFTRWPTPLPPIDSSNQEDVNIKTPPRGVIKIIRFPN